MSQTTQDQAADYAYNHLLKRPYNWVWWNNKTSNTTTLNCSQLVWYAYKYATGVDLDTNGGAAVYPRDIRDSNYAYIYSHL